MMGVALGATLICAIHGATLFIEAKERIFKEPKKAKKRRKERKQMCKPRSKFGFK